MAANRAATGGSAAGCRRGGLSLGAHMVPTIHTCGEPGRRAVAWPFSLTGAPPSGVVGAGAGAARVGVGSTAPSTGNAAGAASAPATVGVASPWMGRSRACTLEGDSAERGVKSNAQDEPGVGLGLGLALLGALLLLLLLAHGLDTLPAGRWESKDPALADAADMLVDAVS